MKRLVIMATVLAVAAHALPVFAQAPARLELNTSQLFVFADGARDRGDYATAEAAYRALAGNADGNLRNEARFRLAMMLAYKQRRYRAAAIELRHILDEQPKVARVRLELARIDELLGHLGDAGRELRAAEAAGLPPEVEKAVRFYAQALDTHRPSGGSIEVTLVPDSNINRATSSGTLGTVIGNFTLNPDAQAHSGLGASVRGQGYERLSLGGQASLLARLSGSATVYGSARFDDMILAPQIGPEWVSARNRVSVAVGPAWRWYGAVPYTFSLAASANWQHAVGRRSQLRLDASFAHIDNLFDALESDNAETIAIGFDRAFSARMGGGLQFSTSRQGARDPGYATLGGRTSVYAYREMGKATITGSLAYGHLEADQRLALFAQRRVDHDVVASFTGTFRQARVGAIVPLVRLTFERQISTLQLYDYRRVVGEFGIASAF